MRIIRLTTTCQVSEDRFPLSQLPMCFLGALVYDPVIGEFETTQAEVVAYPFIEANK